MGISTIQSYHGAQVFEAVGLSQDFVDEYFTWTASRVGGVGIDVIAKEARMRHERASRQAAHRAHQPPRGGDYQYRAGGESISPTRRRSTSSSTPAGPGITRSSRSTRPWSTTSRGSCARCAPDGLPRRQAGADRRSGAGGVDPAPLKSGAMSYGSISKEAHETLAIAMNRIGASPTRARRRGPGTLRQGAQRRFEELRDQAGGERPVRGHQLLPGQCAGVTNQNCPRREAGEGGQLPGNKYTLDCQGAARDAGVGLISPPPHHDIYSIEDLRS